MGDQGMQERTDMRMSSVSLSCTPWLVLDCWCLVERKLLPLQNRAQGTFLLLVLRWWNYIKCLGPRPAHACQDLWMAEKSQGQILAPRSSVKFNLLLLLFSYRVPVRLGELHLKYQQVSESDPQQAVRCITKKDRLHPREDKGKTPYWKPQPSHGSTDSPI